MRRRGMNWRKWVVALVMLGMAGGAQAQSLAFQRAEHLRRGVNLSSFYAQTRDLSQARLDAYMSVADMQALKAMGFDHVRLSINPELPMMAFCEGASSNFGFSTIPFTASSRGFCGIGV